MWRYWRGGLKKMDENNGGVLSILSNRYIGDGYANMIDGIKLIKYQNSSILCIVGGTSDIGKVGYPMCYNIDFNVDNTDFIVSGLSKFGWLSKASTSSIDIHIGSFLVDLGLLNESIWNEIILSFSRNK